MAVSISFRSPLSSLSTHKATTTTSVTPLPQFRLKPSLHLPSPSVQRAVAGKTLAFGTPITKSFTIQNEERGLSRGRSGGREGLSLSQAVLPTSLSFGSSAGLAAPTHDLSVKASVAVVDPNQLASSEPANKEEVKKYYFLVANAKFMLDEEEHFQEQLFERLRLFAERNKEQDFWLVIEPKFLDNFPNIAKRLKRPAVALVSTDRVWIKFMKLRLDRVLAESFEADNLEEALASSNPTKLEFKKPDNWVAPYPKYESGWWETFLPQGSNKTKA